MLVNRALLDKHKTLKFDPLQAPKRTLEAFTKGGLILVGASGLLTPIHLYNVRKVYSKHISPPQAENFAL